MFLFIGNGIFEITVPTEKKLAAIIDGQHRLFAFNHISDIDRLDVELPCSIFFDLPNSYQAFLFATINGNQKNVDKSLALEQFGFNVEDEDKKSWTPEKLAVFISRRLNFSETKKSAFFGRIKVAPIFDEEAFKNMNKSNWIISTATIVDGILSLISSNPKRDRVEMGQKHIFKGRHRDMLHGFRDNAPFRDEFITLNDDFIYNTVFDYFEQVKNILWENAKPGSYIFKTVGIQALFELLKKILLELQKKERISYIDFLRPVASVDFSDNYFQASGVGRSRIKKVLFVSNNFPQKLNEEDESSLKRLINYEKS
ncbi:DGQHR domain-containing protein [Gaoshiqia sp. Z1-71]|uniref:DGQHR domain-containing protein n=1 Tax=Gaoshiqia hydrogeniformans TaxID=3290090 RepID=UPI003BF8AD46